MSYVLEENKCLQLGCIVLRQNSMMVHIMCTSIENLREYMDTWGLHL